MAECGDRLINRKARWVRSDFEKNSARLAKVDRVEIVAVHLRTDVVAFCDKLVSGSELLGVVISAEGNVMNCPRAEYSGPKTGDAAKVNDRAKAFVACGKTKNARLLADWLKPHCIDEELSGEVAALLP